MPLDRPSDAPATGVSALTRRLAAGDEAAFREFHALYFDRLYRYLLVVTRGHEHAAQDAVQETLLRVVRYARKFETGDAFWGWLKVIARNAARDGGRKQRRYLAVLERLAFWRSHVPAAPPSPDGAAADDRLRALLDESLGELPAPDRALLEGKYLQGATVLELAENTGLTEKAVEARLARSRRALGEVLLKKIHRA